MILAHQRIDREQARKRARDLIATVGIPDPDWRMQGYPHEFSGGMCQRIGIAMAVANSPRLILADEPTSGLDVTVQIQILDLLRDEAREQGSAAVVVTRDLGIVAHYCQRVAVMARGGSLKSRAPRTFSPKRDPARVRPCSSRRSWRAAAEMGSTIAAMFRPNGRVALGSEG